MNKSLGWQAYFISTKEEKQKMPMKLINQRPIQVKVVKGKGCFTVRLKYRVKILTV